MMKRRRRGCGSRGGARKFPSFFSIPGETVKERIFSIVRFISVNFGEQTIRFFLYPAGWNGWSMEEWWWDDKARGIILEIYLKFVLERQNWKIIFARVIPLKIYEINFSDVI